MKILSLLVCLFLLGCTTTSVVEKPIAMVPPLELVTPPMNLVEIVASSDGTVDLKGALATAVINNGAARHNAEQLQKLEDWLKDTENNVKKANEKH